MLHPKHRHIEVEIRGEVLPSEVAGVIKRLRALGFRHVSSTRRTSVMSFGETTCKGRGWSRQSSLEEDVDIRCRVTNGKAEVVAKIGQTHADHRLEIVSPVNVDQLLLFAKMFASMGFFTKVGSRFGDDFARGPVTVSLAQSLSKVTYIELEIMSDRKNQKQDLARLKQLAKELGTRLFKNREEFLKLCDRLTRQDDWEFHGTPQDIQRLRKEIKRTQAKKIEF